MNPGDPSTAVAQVTSSPATPQAKRKGISPIFVVLVLVLLGLVYLASHMTGTSPLAAIVGPQKLFGELVTLKEGEARDYSFTNTRNRKVEVSVQASPKPVTVWLVDDNNFTLWKNSHAALFGGGGFVYFPDLSQQKTTSMKKDAVLPEGRFHILVERPKESILFQDSSTANVLITGY